MVRTISVRVRAICSATESEEKVVKAVSNVLGMDLKDAVRWTRTTGIFGDPLSVMEVELRGEEAELAAERLTSKLPEGYAEERSVITGSHEVVHVRLDKQAAFTGQFVLGERDAIKVEIRRERV
ncbi:MAG: hypothetical protein NZ957_03500 [Thaumarchaeota archaeon]|nr:hypothetical protein [Candidatus Calditenuaceae archaeon]MDW8042426.1 RNA-binding domain-containing protein [Nitrososphaerota archaeon]